MLSETSINNEAQQNDDAVGAGNVAGEVQVPPRPDWLPAKSKPVKSKENRAKVELRDIHEFLMRRNYNIFELIYDFVHHPLDYVPQISGVSVSFILHSLFIIVIAFFYFTAPKEGKEGAITLLSGQEGEDFSINHIDTSLAMENTPDVMNESKLDMTMITTSDEGEENLLTNTERIFNPSSFEQKPQAESARKPTGKYTPPAGAKVFVKGSFTAYTVPNDPEPEEDYYIVILVKVPKNMDKYPSSDLTGNIVGTDGWDQPIIDKIFLKRNKYLEVKDEYAQIVVRVPGAYKLTKDTINIKSKILNESQRVEIEF